MRLVYAAIAAIALFTVPAVVNAAEKPGTSATQGKKGKKEKKGGKKKGEGVKASTGATN